MLIVHGVYLSVISITETEIFYVFIDCVNGSVRLVGGSASNEGTIEICGNSLWGLISDAGWDQNDARVVCKQLDLPYDGMYGIISNYSDS